MNELVVKEKNNISNIRMMLIYFFLYSFIGWLLEVIYALIVLGEFVNRGFLFGPLCPIYGYGALLLIITLRNVKDNKPLKFIVTAVVFSIFEFVVSYVLELLFGLRWWDYSNDFMNLQGRISIMYSLLWGVLGLFFTEKLHPFMQKVANRIIEKIPKQMQGTLLSFLTIALITDTVLSVLAYLAI